MSDTDEESDEEFGYNSPIDDSSSSDDESSDKKVPCVILVLTIYFMEHMCCISGRTSYYVGNVSDIASSGKESEITLNLMKKFNVQGKNIYFI